MIINKHGLLLAQPLSPMIDHKKTETIRGITMSYGLTECGYDFRLAQDIWLFPGRRFVLGSTIEKFRVPPYLMGRVMNKSSWARQGIDISRSTNLEPGWVGFLTLEITYSKLKPILLPKGIGIGQVIFERINEEAYYSGKYQNQPEGPVKAIT